MAERQPQDAPARVVAEFAVGKGRPELIQLVAAGADDELADATRGIRRSVALLRRKPLVDVLVPRQHDLHAGGVQRIEERPHLPVAAVGRTRVERRIVPIRDRAQAAAGLREIRLQPEVLRRPGGDVDEAVERDEMPAPVVEAVVAAAIRARLRAEIAEVPFAARGVVVVVAGGRANPVLERAPGGVEAVREFGGPAVVVRVVAQREDERIQRRDECGSPGRRARGRRCAEALADVSRRDDRERGLRPRHAADHADAGALGVPPLRQHLRPDRLAGRVAVVRGAGLAVVVQPVERQRPGRAAAGRVGEHQGEHFALELPVGIALDDGAFRGDRGVEVRALRGEPLPGPEAADVGGAGGVELEHPERLPGAAPAGQHAGVERGDFLR